MNSVAQIPLERLALTLVPVLVVGLIFAAWSLSWRTLLYAMARMLVQLLAIGYLLAFVFETDQFWVVLGVLTVMVLSASWIGLRTVPQLRLTLYGRTLFSVLIGGGVTLLIVTQAVLALEPWFSPRAMIPLAGMIFANGMTAVSLAADRILGEVGRTSYEEARRVAFRAALIPSVNALFAVGLVALPGMMTGQILSGVSPLIAARYQIMVMCMVLASAGMSSALFLVRSRAIFEAHTSHASEQGV
jgi:putative ABC transport system permease protein